MFVYFFVCLLFVVFILLLFVKPIMTFVSFINSGLASSVRVINNTFTTRVIDKQTSIHLLYVKYAALLGIPADTVQLPTMYFVIIIFVLIKL